MSKHMTEKEIEDTHESILRACVVGGLRHDVGMEVRQGIDKLTQALRDAYTQLDRHDEASKDRAETRQFMRDNKHMFQ